MDKTVIDIQEVWYDFIETRTIDLKHKLILHYIWLVKYVLNSMHLPTNSILTEDDFLSVGILGLHEAIERFQLDRGVKFESYAIPRIKGIIQDELRRLDWLSRTARKKASDFIQATDKLRSEQGREVSTEEIRTRLNVSEEEYQSYLMAAAAAKASAYMSESSQVQFGEEETDIFEDIADYSEENTLDRMENEERMDFITAYLHKLNERKRLVMTLYYYESLTFKEIGQILQVSESRVCQIHSQVVADLREKLNEFDNA
jgi:RNA polymerase sigma factor FliA